MPLPVNALLVNGARISARAVRPLPAPGRVHPHGGFRL